MLPCATISVLDDEVVRLYIQFSGNPCASLRGHRLRLALQHLVELAAFRLDRLFVSVHAGKTPC
jgi:hypothetical protein